MWPHSVALHKAAARRITTNGKSHCRVSGRLIKMNTLRFSEVLPTPVMAAKPLHLCMNPKIQRLICATRCAKALLQRHPQCRPDAQVRKVESHVAKNTFVRVPGRSTTGVTRWKGPVNAHTPLSLSLCLGSAWSVEWLPEGGSRRQARLRGKAKGHGSDA